MKKFLSLCIVCLSLISIQLHAQEKKFGYFNSLSIGANIGTTGWGIDVATPIGQYLALRAGITIMPNFSYSDEVDIDYATSQSYDVPASMEVEGSMGRTAGEVLLNFYPFKRASFFISGGAVFGGDKLIKVKGHSNELANLQAQAGEAGIEIGDYTIPVDKNGNVSGGIKVSSFRPYLGLGFGRIVPKKRVGFLFELGVQFHNTPEVYTDYGNIGYLDKESENDFSEILDKLTIYPVLRFRLCGRIF